MSCPNEEDGRRLTKIARSASTTPVMASSKNGSAASIVLVVVVCDGGVCSDGCACACVAVADEEEWVVGKGRWRRWTTAEA